MAVLTRIHREKLVCSQVETLNVNLLNEAYQVRDHAHRALTLHDKVTVSVVVDVVTCDFKLSD